MADEFSEQFVRDILGELARRCEAARSLGGVALRDVYDGATIPKGWELDFLTDYFVPSIDALDEASRHVH